MSELKLREDVGVGGGRDHLRRVQGTSLRHRPDKLELFDRVDHAQDQGAE